MYTNLDNNVFTYLWTGPNGFTSTQQYVEINGYDKKAQGTYTATITDEFGCTSKATTEVKFKNPDCPYYLPVLYNIGNNEYNSYNREESLNFPLVACQGSEVILKIDTTYFGTSKIQWYKDDKEVSGATSLTYFPKDKGVYYASLIGKSCEYQSRKIDLRFITSIRPSISANALENNSIKICNSGGTTQLYGNVSNNVPVNRTIFQWYKNDQLIEGANNSSYLVNEAGNYRLNVQADNCIGESETVKIIGVDKIDAKIFFNQVPTIKDLKLCENSTNTIYVSTQAEGSQLVFYNGQQINSSNYNVQVTAAKSGTYKLSVTQGKCTASDSVTITYGKKQDLIIKNYRYASSNCSALNNGNITYYPEYYLQNGNYQWFKDNILYDNIPFLYPNTAGNYQLKYTNAQTGCTGESSVIKIDSKFYDKQIFRISTAPTAKNIKLCKGGSFYISNQTECYSGSIWKKDGKVIPNTEPCNYTATEAGKYWYEYTTGSCTYYSDTITIEEIQLPTVSIKDSCGKNNTVILSALNSTGTSYQWYQNSIAVKGAINNTFTPIGANGIVQVQVGKNGCFANSNAIVTGIVTSKPNVSVCRGDTLKLTSTGGNIKSYNWTGPNNFTSNQQNIAIPNAKIAGIYTITATANSGCIFTNKSTVSIGDYPTFSLSKSIIACEGQELQINAIKSKKLTDSTETADYINWKGPNQFTSGNYNPVISKVSSANAGVYTASVRSYYSECQVTATTALSIDKSGNCKSLSILNRLDSAGYCANSNAQLYFNSTGFTSTTKYKVIRGSDNTVLGEGTKSPISFKIPNTNINYSSKENLYIIADDGITRSLDKFYSINSVGTSSRILQSSYDESGNENEFKSCDLLNLYIIIDEYGTKDNVKTIQWLLDGKEIKSSSPTKLTATKSGNYSVKLTNPTGCTSESPLQKVIIGQMPKPYVYGQFELLCGQDNTTLSTYLGQNPDLVYKWRRDGNIQTNANGGSLKATKTGKYIVEASLGQCSATSDTIVVTKSVNNKLPIALNRYESSTQILDCETRNLVINYGTDNAYYDYFKQWQLQLYKDGVEVGLKKYNSSGFIVKEAGVYSMKASLGDCQGVSNEVKIESRKTKKANLNYRQLNLCEGKSTYFYKYTSFNNGYDYEKNQYINVTKRESTIYRDGKLIDVKNKVNFDPTVEQVYDYGDFIQLFTPVVGKYFIIETAIYSDNSECTALSDTIQIKSLKQIQLSNYDFDKSINAVPISSCKDTVTVNGDFYSNGTRPVSYTWKKDGVVTKDSTYQLTTAQAGTYQLETKYKGGCSAISQPYKIDFGKIKLTTNISEYTVCEGVMTNLYLYANRISGTNDTNKVTYQWQKDGQNIVKETNTDYYAKQEGKYKLTAKQGKCEGTSPEVSIKLDKLPTSVSPIDTAKFCEGASTPLSLSTEAGLSYQWEVDGSGIKNAKSSLYGAASEGTYQALLRRGTCWDYSKKVKVTANILPKTISISDTLICPNLTTILKVIPDLKAGTKGLTYTWEKDNKVTTLTNTAEVKAQDKGLYRVQFKRENCSAYSNVVKLNNKDIPTIISPLDTAFCANGKVDLKGQNVANTAYQWEKDEKAITNATTANLTISEVGKYRILVKKDGCEVYSKIANVAQKPATTATLTGDKSINYADSSKVSIAFTSDAPWTFKLSNGRDYTATKSPFEVSLKPQFTTTYSITEVKNICGIGTTSGTAKIEVIILSAEQEQDLNVEVFPVPSTEICNWKIHTPQATVASVILYDVLGKILHTHTSPVRTQTHEGAIDLTILKGGTYFLKFQVGEKSVTRKVVKY